MTDAIILNAFALVFIPIILGFFAPRGDRFVAWATSTIFALNFTFLGWLIFVAVHFASKYW